MLEKFLSLIEELNKNVKNLIEIQLQQTNSLRTIGDVAKYLDKSTKTINNYIKDGRFKIYKHYFKNPSGKIEFIPEGIMEFKKCPYIKNEYSPINMPVEVIFDSDLYTVNQSEENKSGVYSVYPPKTISDISYGIKKSIR